MCCCSLMSSLDGDVASFVEISDTVFLSFKFILEYVKIAIQYRLKDGAFIFYVFISTHVELGFPFACLSYIKILILYQIQVHCCENY